MLMLGKVIWVCTVDEGKWSATEHHTGVVMQTRPIFIHIFIQYMYNMYNYIYIVLVSQVPEKTTEFAFEANLSDQWSVLYQSC